MGHGLKTQTQRDNMVDMFTDFTNLTLPGLDLSKMPETEFWVDLGIEDVPLTSEVTLLRKESCLRNYERHFWKGEANHYTSSDNFPFMMTRDASSKSVTLTPSNPLSAQGGISYIKVYNINKDLFATPFKTYDTFDNG